MTVAPDLPRELDSNQTQAMAAGPVRITDLRELDPRRVADCAARYGARIVLVPDGAAIPFSYWGAPEAGLAGARLFARGDTPAHSALHELSHFVCMTETRRQRLVKDAGGDANEECAVCYLQVLLAEQFPELGRARLLAEMDAWGYSFREGTAAAWWHGDARFARDWLLARGLISSAGEITWRKRA